MPSPSSEYRAELTFRAHGQLKKMNRFDARILVKWIKNNLDACTNSRALGKGLTVNHSGKWRYRVGAYRTLALIHDDAITIEVLSIGRRDKICTA